MSGALTLSGQSARRHGAVHRARGYAIRRGLQSARQPAARSRATQVQNLRVDVDAGTVITDANLNPGTPQVVGTAFSNSYAGATGTTQYELDVAGGRTGAADLERRAGDGRSLH